MTASLGDATLCVHDRGDEQRARHAQEAREGRLRLVFLPCSSLGARVRTIYGLTPYEEHVGRHLPIATNKVVLQDYHWLGCFWGIAASMPDAVAAMKKPIRSV